MENFKTWIIVSAEHIRHICSGLLAGATSARCVTTEVHMHLHRLFRFQQNPKTITSANMESQGKSMKVQEIKAQGVKR